MNETDCENLIQSVKWTEPSNLVVLAILQFINILVIGGNLLVIAAVLCSHKLRSVTNFFIVNLAVADFLVGITVLPFSATWEVFKVWIFGSVWCRIWLAMDVWMCTASILNLCAISLDRYVAVTRPITYPKIMSTKRAKSLIAGIWLLSFFICFPPLIGWKEQQQLEKPIINYTMYYVTENTKIITSTLRSSLSSIYYSDLIDKTIDLPKNNISVLKTQALSFCRWKCELTNNRSYVLYSALGSFYIPMFVMLFFYWKIYRAAIQTTKAFNQGFRTTKGNAHESKMKSIPDKELILRIHRGRSYRNINQTPAAIHQCLTSTSTHNICDDIYQLQLQKPEAISLSKLNSNLSLRKSKPNSGQIIMESKSTLAITKQNVTFNTVMTKDRKSLFHRNFSDIMETSFISKQPNKQTTKFHRRFKIETKAAKTLAIIISAFIFSWLPFFTVYLIRAFCDICIQPIVFSILFWLGYCNSAINPFIYALFSYEFRIAFKRILCRCVCTCSGFRASQSFQMVVGRALMSSATFNKTISSFADEIEPDEDFEGYGIEFS